MKKYLAILCATMLCVCCLALAACGGSSSSSAAASGSASASASSESASSAAASSASASASSAASSASASTSASSAAASGSFEGVWKLAAIESQGITMVGDFSSILGQDTSASITINADGTGTLNFGGTDGPFTWEKKDANTATITPTSDNASGTTFDIILDNGALKMSMDEQLGAGSYAVFTADGTYPGAKVISADAATPITSEDELVGTWRLSGMNMAGMSMYGDADALSQMSGGSFDTSVTFEKGGKVSFMGDASTYAVSADGAVLTTSGIDLPIKKLGDDITLDLSGFIGMEFIMVYSK